MRLQHGELSKRDELIEELQRQVDELADRLEESDNGGVTDAASSAQRIATGVVTATRLGQGVYANVHCRNCNSYTGMLVGSDQCPGCGAPIG